MLRSLRGGLPSKCFGIPDAEDEARIDVELERSKAQLAARPKLATVTKARATADMRVLVDIAEEYRELLRFFSTVAF